MSELPPVILIASASAYERRRMRRKLDPTQWLIEDVSSAKEAARFCEGNWKAVILVIDGGLLAETASPEWRALRERYPEVGAVVRSLIPRGGGDPSTGSLHHLRGPRRQRRTARSVASAPEPARSAAAS